MVHSLYMHERERDEVRQRNRDEREGDETEKMTGC